MIYLQLFAFCFVALSVTEPVRAVCDTLEHIDQTLANTIQYFGNRNQAPVTSEAIWQKNCDRYEHNFQTVQAFIENCMKDTSQSMASILAKSYKAQFDKRCKDATFTSQFIEHNKCFEDPAIFEQFHQCADRCYHHMEALKGLNQDATKNIQSSCCILRDFQQCISEKNVNLCHDRNAAFWNAFLDDIVDDHRAEFCSNLQTDEQCKSNFPKDTWAALDGAVAKMDANALKERPGRFKSLVISLLDMASGYKL